MKDIQLNKKAKTLPEVLGISIKRAKEIVDLVHSHEHPNGQVTDTLGWAVFTEELNNNAELVFAVYSVGIDVGRMTARRDMLSGEFKKLFGDSGEEDE